MNSHRLSSFSSSSSFQLSASCGIWTYSHDPHLENSLPALHIFAAKNIVCDIYRTTSGNVDRIYKEMGKENRGAQSLTALG